MVATSVCTGCRKCPPDTFTAMGSSPPVTCNKKHRVADATLCFLAPPVGLEPTTCGLTVIRRNSPLIFLRPLSQISPVIMDLFKVMD